MMIKYEKDEEEEEKKKKNHTTKSYWFAAKNFSCIEFESNSKSDYQYLATILSNTCASYYEKGYTTKSIIAEYLLTNLNTDLMSIGIEFQCE